MYPWNLLSLYCRRASCPVRGNGDFFRLFGLPAGVGQAEREFLVGDGSEDSGKFLAPRPGIKRCRKHDFQFASYVISQLVDFEEGALEPRRGNFERPVGGEGVFHVEGETREPRQFRALIDGDALREQIVVGGLFGRSGFGAGKDVDAQFNAPDSQSEGSRQRGAQFGDEFDSIGLTHAS